MEKKEPTPHGLFEADLPKRGDVKAGIKALAASLKRGKTLVKPKN